ncbi:hydroxysteroid dehydrogenase-like protein 1 isoform X2 [Chironomus tepperi]|uniref:hydroxysteroid dehydrogenase-like protein 1 isoform X2 n=1 Tax=Chironomus tepperi TaxID=113505 RepID=UPI00391F0E75
MELFSENIKLFTSIIGIYAIIWWSIEHFTSLFEFIINSIKPYIKCQCKRTLQSQYGQWAVVTGATSGIGKYYAIELAKKGMDVCLISRSEDNLISLAHDLGRFGVSTKIIVADFSQGELIYNNIELQLRDLDIGILVNNVGTHEDPDQFDKLSHESLWRMINVNVGAITFMSKIVIPKMKIKNKGLILNVSSGSQYQPTPLLALYGATKSYTRNLSLALNRELVNFNVKVHLIIPFYVKTNMTRYLNVPDKGSLFSPNAKVYIKSAIKTLGNCAHTSGYWCHSIQFTLFTTLPEFVRVFLTQNFHSKLRRQKQKLLKSQIKSRL